MSDLSRELRKFVEKPMSVTVDTVVSVAVGIVVYFLLGLIEGLLPFSDALRPALAGVAAAMVYMRARMNIMNPAVKFE